MYLEFTVYIGNYVAFMYLQKRYLKTLITVFNLNHICEISEIELIDGYYPEYFDYCYYLFKNYKEIIRLNKSA